MKKAVILIAATTLMLTACNKPAEKTATTNNPLLTEWKTPYGMPPFDDIKVSDYLPAVKVGIEEQKKEIETIVNNTEAPTFDNTIGAYELSGQTLAKVVGVLFNVSETDNTDELIKVMDEAMPLLTEHEDNIFMNKGLFERVKAVYEADQSTLTREQQMVLKKIYQHFTRNGIGLDEAGQAKMREINQKLAAAQQKFGNNLLAENNAFKDKFGVTVSAYTSEMTSCSDASRREALFKAYASRGNNDNENDNKALCMEILQLRAQKAELLGFPNYAAYELDDKMAHDPATVDKFLGEIMVAATAKAKEELADMAKIKGSKIEPWDWFFYAEKVRAKKFALDENLTKPYFRMENVRNGIFEAAHMLYGITVEPAPEVPVYNKEAVEAFRVLDADGSLLGILTTDYFPRSSKRGGAWMNPIREQYVDANGNDVRPIIVNVGNMTPPTDSTPSLLTIDEVETVFHEFGHALHGLLTKCHYRDVSGTNVARDFVETFSQFNENWAFQPEILAKYAMHYKTGEVIPDSLVAKINNALKFNQGFMTSELCAASILDMKWHELTSTELAAMAADPEGIAAAVSKFEKKVCTEMGLIDEIIPRYRTTYFNHIFNSGYCAGYYSYLWSEVLDKDAFEYFVEHGLYNQDIAKKFRQTFLEKGGSEEPMKLYIDFRGAEPTPEAMLKGRGLK